MHLSIIITPRQYFFTSRSQYKSMLPLGNIRAFHITQWRVRVNHPLLDQIFQWQNISRNIRFLKPSLTETQGVVLYYRYFVLFSRSCCKRLLILVGSFDLLASGNLSCSVSSHLIIGRILSLLTRKFQLHIVTLITSLHLSLILRMVLFYQHEFCKDQLNVH